MPVHHINSESDLGSLLSAGKNNNGDLLLLIDFSAEWCGPCKMIAPIFEGLSSKYGHSNFLFAKVDVDQCSDLAQSQNIRAMPTFVFYKNSLSTEITRIQGADAQALEGKCREFSGQYKSYFGGEGTKLGGGGSAPDVKAGSCQLSAEEVIQIAQSNIEYSLSTCVRVGFRFQPSIQGGVLAGSKPFLRINASEKTSRLRVFVNSLLETSGVTSTTYELHNSYPPGKLDEDKSINESGIAGTLVVVKFIK